MSRNRNVTVYGAYGHTGCFVVDELLARGWAPVLAGRSPHRLNALRVEHPELETRAADVSSPGALDEALDGAAAVVNCAGPFASTARPVVDAALRAGIPYLDVAAEIEANLDTFAHYADPARDAGIVVMPAMAFYGGLGDLLATAAMGDWPDADEVSIAYGLSSWAPTAGTRASGRVSGERRGGRRVVYAHGRLDYRSDEPPPTTVWDFPPPLGRQPVVAEFTMADSVTIPRHLVTPEIRSYMTVAAVHDVTNPDLPPPGRDSAQTFLVDVVVCRGTAERRAAVGGRDIYGITAPLVVEATERVLDGRVSGVGTLSAGQAFDAQDFLAALPVASAQVVSG
jgi:NAD(P)-dependent dehydrogenase (short-subunit alcohol dehydrogenase family)